MAINYKNGKIYKIEPKCEHDEGDVYIGSTTKQYLSQRMVSHRDAYYCFKRGSRQYKITSCDLFDKYGIENCDIILLESVEAKSKDELSAREAHYIRTIKCVNRFVPLRTQQEYRQDKKDAISQKNKTKFTCDCGKTLRKSDRAAHYKTFKHLNYCPTSTD